MASMLYAPEGQVEHTSHHQTYLVRGGDQLHLIPWGLPFSVISRTELHVTKGPIPVYTHSSL